MFSNKGCTRLDTAKNTKVVVGGHRELADGISDEFVADILKPYRSTRNI